MTSVEHLTIHKFNIQDMDIDSKVAIIGKPGTGKSVLIKDLLYQHRKRFSSGMILSGTEGSNKFYRGIFQDTFIYHEYNQDAMDRLKVRQQQLVRDNGKGDPRNFTAVVCDDCMDDKNWIKHKTTKWLFKNGRWFDIFFLLAMQYMLDIPPDLRTCIDYIFILQEPMVKNRKKLYENFGGVIPTFNMFNDMMDNLTADYCCMVIKNRKALSNNIEDSIYWYKAPFPSPEFKIGSRALWKYHEENYNDQYEREEEEEALKRSKAKKYGRGRKKTTFVVKKLKY